MRRLFLICLLALVAGVFLVSLLEKDPGYILIAYGDTTIEMSVWTGIALALTSFFLLYLIIRSWTNTRKIPAKVGGWMDERNEKATSNHANRGLTAFVEGHWDRASKSLEQVAERSDKPLVYYLLAAQAGQAMGDEATVEKNLVKAQQSSGGNTSDLAVGLAQGQLQLDRGQLEQALATLTRVKSLSSAHPVTLKLLAQTYERLDDWEQLRKLLPELKRSHAFPATELAALERKVYSSLLGYTTSASPHAVSELEHTWKLLPKELAADAEMQCVYARQLVAAGAPVAAEKFLRKALRKSWDERLVHAYGLAPGEDLVQQMQLAESWLKDRPNNAELLLCLGRLALDNQAWDKAQEYLEASLSLSNRPETCAELANLLARLGKPEQSIDYFKQCVQGATASTALAPLPAPAIASLPGGASGQPVV
jgi:HemY protein